jgi:hypothetical protein
MKLWIAKMRTNITKESKLFDLTAIRWLLLLNTTLADVECKGIKKTARREREI